MCILLLSMPAWSQPSSGSDSIIKKNYLIAKQKYTEYEKKHGRYLQTTNILMHYLVWGETNTRTLIWCHGSLSNAYEFADYANAVTKMGYRVIAIDYYGHGRTNIPTHEVSLYHVADDIKELIDSLGIKKVVIGGWSRGGYIATAFYDSYPASVSGIILEDGGSVASNKTWHKLSMDSLNTRVLALAREMPKAVQYETEFDGYKAWYDEKDGTDQFDILPWLVEVHPQQWEVCPGVLELCNMETAPKYLQTILRPTLATLFGESMAIIEPKLIYRNLNIPLLILDPISETDPFPVEMENQALKQSHSNWITYTVFKNCDHNIHYQYPKEFTTAITSFLRSLGK